MLTRGSLSLGSFPFLREFRSFPCFRLSSYELLLIVKLLALAAAYQRICLDTNPSGRAKG